MRIDKGRCGATTRAGSPCRRAGSPRCYQHVGQPVDSRHSLQSDQRSASEAPGWSGGPATSDPVARLANLTMPKIDPKIFEPLFANLTMPSIEPKIFEPLFANLNLSTVVAGLPVLASEWIEQGPEGVRLQDYVMAATIAVAPATDLAPLESSEKASRVMGTAIVIMALWAVFMRTPELRPVLEFLAFPLTIGSYIWAALNKD